MRWCLIHVIHYSKILDEFAANPLHALCLAVRKNLNLLAASSFKQHGLKSKTFYVNSYLSYGSYYCEV
jgi:hypothetical protein